MQIKKVGASRPVNWTVWRNIPEAKLWQAVALSLDIDPDKVQHNRDSCMAESYLFDESQEFKDRMQVATACAGRSLKTATLSLTHVEECKVELAVFTAWAKTLKWIICKDLIAIAHNAPRLAPTNIHTDTRLDPRERNSLLRIIRALDVMAGLKDRGAASPLFEQLQKLGFTDGPGDTTIRKLLEQARALEPDSKPL